MRSRFSTSIIVCVLALGPASAHAQGQDAADATRRLAQLEQKVASLTTTPAAAVAPGDAAATLDRLERAVNELSKAPEGQQPTPQRHRRPISSAASRNSRPGSTP
jgi:hypothetical protein